METGSLDPRLVQAIIQSLYRLFRVGTFHALDNEAVGLSIQATQESLRQVEQFESEGITLIFAEDTAIVNGQLLRAAPDVYESAMDFARFLDKLGVNAITIGKGVAEPGLRKLLALFIDKGDPGRHLDENGYLSPHIRMRMVNPNLLLGLEDERLGQLERVLLTYALSVLVIRRLFTSIANGGFDLAGYFKRMARQLSLVNYTDRPVVFDVLLARHLQPDVAKLAVNSAILAVAMTRRFTDHDAALSRACMSALLLDIGRHRPAALRTPDDPAPLPVSTAIVHMAMGSLRGDSIDRAIITYEAQSLLDGVDPAAVYPSNTPPTVDAHIVATARRFVELITQRSDGKQLTTDGAIAWLHAHARSDLAHLAVDLLVDAIGLIPRGTCVELNSGYRGIVMRAGPAPSQYNAPTVRLMEDGRGNRIEPVDIVLSDGSEEAERHKPVMRVISRPGPVLAAAQKKIGGPLLMWLQRRKDSEAQVLDWVRAEADWRDQVGVLERRADTSGAHRVSDHISSVTNARARAVGWTGSESGAVDAVGGPARTLSRSAAAAEFERRAGKDPLAVSDFAAVGTGLKRTVSSSSGSANTGSGAIPRQVSASVRRSAPSVGSGSGSGSGSESGSASGAARALGSGVHRTIPATSPSQPASSVHRVARGSAAHPAATSASGAFVATTDPDIDPNEFGAEGSTGVRAMGSGVYRRPRTGTGRRDVLPSEASGSYIGAARPATEAQSGATPAVASPTPESAHTPRSLAEHLAAARARQAEAEKPRDPVRFETPMAGTGILRRTGSKKAVGKKTSSRSTASEPAHPPQAPRAPQEPQPPQAPRAPREPQPPQAPRAPRAPQPTSPAAAPLRSPPSRSSEPPRRPTPSGATPTLTRAVSESAEEDFGRDEGVTPLHPKGPTE